MGVGHKHLPRNRWLFAGENELCERARLEFVFIEWQAFNDHRLSIGAHKADEGMRRAWRQCRRIVIRPERFWQRPVPHRIALDD